MVECRTSGIGWDEIYNWNVDEFTEVYHALQRNDARLQLRNYSTIAHAFGGGKKEVKKFIDNLSVWLPAHERNGGAKGKDDFVQLIRDGVKLKRD